MKSSPHKMIFLRILGLGCLLSFASKARADYQFGTVTAAAGLGAPNAIAVDASGNTYIAESGTNTIRKLTPSGVWTIFAGSSGLSGSTDGAGSNARFDFPQGVAVDKSGNVYVADTGNNTIRKITPEGVVSTLAGVSGGGNGAGYGSADGAAGNASFRLPYGVAVDAANNVYVADTFNHTVRKITPNGEVSTLAGTAGSTGSVNDTGAAARFNLPRSVAVDGAGFVYVADSANHLIRKISPTGVTTTLAGAAGSFGNVDGTASVARFAFPHSVASDRAGNVYVADTFNNSIRRITPDGVVTTVAGAASTGSVDGIGTAARFNRPDGIALNAVSDIYVADTTNNSIRRGILQRSIWLANGAEFQSSVDLGTFNPSWQVAAAVDFNADGKPDILWQNISTGERYVWLMNGTTHVGDEALGVVAPNWTIAAAADFNGDGKADILWHNTVTGALYVWLMNGTARIGQVDPGAALADSTIAGAADMNGDGKADIIWQNTVTGERYVWLMNGAAHTTATLPAAGTDWQIACVADFNGDGKADIFWQNRVSGERYVWLMNGTTQTGGVSLGTVPTDRLIAAVADFNGDGKADVVGQMPGIKTVGSDFNLDGKPDVVWQNLVTGERFLWLMSGTVQIAGASLGSVGSDWSIAATPDLNGDGQPDLLWENTVTGQRFVWFMNGAVQAGGVSLGTVGTDWKIAATPDFNRDGKPDILWQNSVTGAVFVWLMDGAIHSGDADLGVAPANSSVSATGDFNGDGLPDILWTNTSTGERTIWFMNGTVHTGDFSLGVVATSQQIVGAPDFNADGKPDILWTNTTTGERYVWFMNGTTHSGDASIGTLSTDWSIVK